MKKLPHLPQLPQNNIKMKTKIISAAILTAILFSTPSTIQAQSGFRTDVDDNGTVNVSDVSYLISFILGKVTDDAVTEGLCPNAMHPHAIDLGLPSGTKWTCCNVGAENPLEYGDYYTWGDMLPQDNYSESNYLYAYYDAETENYSYFSIGDDIAGTSHDVAAIKWGTKYSMPSNLQFKELAENCTYSFITINGVNGALFTATNGNKVFLPAAGNRWDDNLSLDGSVGNYWSSVQNPSNSDSAAYLYFYSDGVYHENWYYSRFCGLSVRPVNRF